MSSVERKCLFIFLLVNFNGHWTRDLIEPLEISLPRKVHLNCLKLPNRFSCLTAFQSIQRAIFIHIDFYFFFFLFLLFFFRSNKHSNRDDQLKHAKLRSYFTCVHYIRIWFTDFTYITYVYNIDRVGLAFWE